jgi:hypothetical protein
MFPFRGSSREHYGTTMLCGDGKKEQARNSQLLACPEDRELCDHTV